MPFLLLFISAVIFICIIFNKLSSRLGIPMLLAFIALGMLMGSDGIFKVAFDDYVFSEQLCCVALIFIMFYGGFGTKWSEARPVASKAILLSTLGVILTAGFTGLFCYLVLHFDFWESFLIGSVVSSTDAASVFSILRSKRLNLKYNTASLLELESGSNDPCSYMLTLIILSVMNGQAASAPLGYIVFAQLVYGALSGIMIAFAALYILRKFHFSTDGFGTIFVLATALFAYALPSAIGGNGYLSVYLAGILLGNQSFDNKSSLVHFFDGITGLMQMLIFFLLGLLSMPSLILPILLPALAIAVFLTFVARPLSVFAILHPFRCPFNQQLLVAWSGLRGAASTVFAIMAVVSPAYMKNDIFHIVFCVVLLSIAIQGSLIPLMAKKLDMIDQNVNVLKTFNDYSDEAPVQFIRLKIKEGHPWRDQTVSSLPLPPDTLLVLLLREEKQLVPRGDTTILLGDILVLTAAAYDNSDIYLSEMKIEANHHWRGKSISALPAEPDKLIVMIQRADNVVIPNGQTVLCEDDILVILKTGAVD